MSEQWKEFEAYCASLFGTKRAWANSGERLDFPRPDQLSASPALGQCKNVQVLSLNALTKLTEEIEQEALRNLIGKGAKLGVVCAKIKRGRGQKSATLIVMTDTMWLWLLDNMSFMQEIQKRREKEAIGVKEVQ